LNSGFADSNVLLLKLYNNSAFLSSTNKIASSMNSQETVNPFFEELLPILLAIAIYVILLVAYKVFKYIWFSIHLSAISKKLNRPKLMWMAWVPILRMAQIAMLGKRPWWFLVWFILYIPSHLFILYLFVENLNDMVETGVKIAHGDILGFLGELISEDYSEAYQLITAVSIRLCMPLLLYARLANECNRSELWAIPIRLVPFVNIFGILWLRLGAGKSLASSRLNEETETVRGAN
jgi:hypothetical protein